MGEMHIHLIGDTCSFDWSNISIYSFDVCRVLGTLNLNPVCIITALSHGIACGSIIERPSAPDKRGIARPVNVRR